MNKQITYFLSCLMVLFVLSSCVTTDKSGKKEETNTETSSQGNSGAGQDDNGEGSEAPSGTHKVTAQGTDIGGGMRMKIMNVQDSRCPTNTNCFVAGEAKIVMEVSMKGESTSTTLIAKGNCEGDDGKCGNTVMAVGQKIQLLSFNPYPEANAKVEHNSYIAKVKVN